MTVGSIIAASAAAAAAWARARAAARSGGSDSAGGASAGGASAGGASPAAPRRRRPAGGAPAAARPARRQISGRRRRHAAQRPHRGGAEGCTDTSAGVCAGRSGVCVDVVEAEPAHHFIAEAADELRERSCPVTAALRIHGAGGMDLGEKLRLTSTAAATASIATSRIACCGAGGASGICARRRGRLPGSAFIQVAWLFSSIGEYQPGEAERIAPQVEPLHVPATGWGWRSEESERAREWPGW